MKVLQILCGRAWGGGSVVVLAITRALIERGDEVWVFSFEEENDRRFREVGAHLVASRFWSDTVSPLDAFAAAGLWRVCRREKFDLVATHTSKGGLIGRIAARLAGVPHIVHHAHGFSFNRALSPRGVRLCVALERLGARFGDFTISVNEQQRRMAVDYGIATRDRSCTVHNGIDLAPYVSGDGSAIRRQLGVRPDTPLIGSIGRLVSQKGLIYLIKAMPFILAEVPEACLVIVGEGPLLSELQTAADACGVGPRVHFLEFRRDVPDLLASFDCYVQPSLWEGLSISLIEALAAARPIVATDIEGNREVIDPGMTGLLVRPAETSALAEAIVQVLRNSDLAAALAANAGRAAVTRFSEQRMVQQNLAVYDRIVSTKRSVPTVAVPGIKEIP
jgi:glycosyltransferase involved in cell wall biosynthesis